MGNILTQFLIDQRVVQVAPYVKGSVLDLGCGRAPILQTLPVSAQYLGVDAYKPVIAHLTERYPGRRFLCRDFEREPLAISEHFDTILLMAVIEHLSKPEQVLAELLPLLQPGGHLVLTTPTPFGNQIHHLGSRVGLFSKEAAEDHKFIFDQRSLETLLTRCGFQVIQYKRFLFHQNQLCVAKAARAWVKEAGEVLEKPGI